MSQVSLGPPEFVPGTPPGHPTAKFLYVIFLYRFFLSIFRTGKIQYIKYLHCHFLSCQSSWGDSWTGGRSHSCSALTAWVLLKGPKGEILSRQGKRHVDSTAHWKILCWRCRGFNWASKESSTSTILTKIFTDRLKNTGDFLGCR